MFGEMDSCVPEMVVASYQAGRFVMDEHAVIQPGVRLYFDNHSIIQARLAVRDGLHTMKVRLRLPLEPYLLAMVSADALAPPGESAGWTPYIFVALANQEFRRLRGS